MTLTIATCQFPVSADVAANARHVLRQMRHAKKLGADVVHFCEGALSGYAGVDFRSFRSFDWASLTECSTEVTRLARQLGIWTLLGSSHPLLPRRKPHNCVYVIDDDGKIVDRYDKRFCAGDRRSTTGDLAHYTPGNHSCVFSIRGIRCGVLICHDYRYPELYREHNKQGVRVMFHSYHAANVKVPKLRAMRKAVGSAHFGLNRGTTLPEITMPATMQAAAACNHVWISCANSSTRESCWPAFFTRADGVITGRLRRHRTGVLISKVDPSRSLYDSTELWRERAMRGVLHSGRTVNDPRSKRRTGL